MNQPSIDPVCELLEWDSAFFGCPVARLRPGPVNAHLLAGAFGWCRENRVRCLYYLAPADDAPSLLAAQAAGMLFVDVRLTLSRALPGPNWTIKVPISPATEGDREALMALAPEIAPLSRFFADPQFGTEAAVRLFERWLEKEADAVLVARTPEGLGGCIVCDLELDGTGVISLFVVSASSRGKGMGKALCAAGLHWFAEQGCSQVRVVTQGHNIAGQRLYQNMGFMTHSVEIWFHKWFDV